MCVVLMPCKRATFLDALGGWPNDPAEMLSFVSNFDHLSVWLIGLVFIALLSVVIEIGYQLGHFLHSKRGYEKHPIESSVTGSVMGLMAFILAFSFGGSASRFSDVRSLALDDVIAIENTFNLATFLPEPDRDAARELLLQYQEIRVSAVKAQDHEVLMEAVRRSEEIQSDLWAIAVKVRLEDNNAILKQFVSSVIVLGNTHTRRVNRGIVTRLPSGLWVTLLFLTTLSSLLLGLSAGVHGRRSRIAATALLIAFCSVIVMIIDLDRPVRSLFKFHDPVGEAVLERMKNEMGKP